MSQLWVLLDVFWVLVDGGQPVSSSGLHRELSAGASRGRQECLDSESSRPWTSGMDAFWTNCTSSWEEEEKKKKRASTQEQVQSGCEPMSFSQVTTDYLWFGVKLIRKHHPAWSLWDNNMTLIHQTHTDSAKIQVESQQSSPQIWPTKCGIVSRSSADGAGHLWVRTIAQSAVTQQNQTSILQISLLLFGSASLRVKCKLSSRSDNVATWSWSTTALRQSEQLLDKNRQMTGGAANLASRVSTYQTSYRG